MLSIEQVPIDRLIPYARNSRTHSPEQVAQIAGSIREFGFNSPVLVDDQLGIIAGHGRVLAAQKLGLETVPCVRLSHLSETQKRAYVIADNKLALNAGWDEEMLGLELSELRENDFDLGLIGFNAEEIEAALNPPEPASGLSDNYTHKIQPPVYEPKGEKPSITELFDKTATNTLIAKIEKANVPEETANFLKVAAARHTVFNFEKIAEFYCHSDKDTQLLMEESALVIIDFKKAIQLGYVKLKEEIAESLEREADQDQLDE